MSQAPAASGSTPPSAQGEVQAAAWVQRMFAQVAARYDLLNHVLSFNIDRGWRKLLLQSLQPVLQRPGALVLDVCCGTGDVLLEFQQSSRARVFGVDFCHPMLVQAQRKIRSRGLRNPLLEGDALSLPLPDRSVDAVAISFGFRNLANYQGGLAELHRVLKPGGTLAILEFSHPPSPIVRWVYGIYSRLVLPWVGALISGSRDAYTYLPESIRKFPHAKLLATWMSETGFADVEYRLLTAGIAALHVAAKPIFVPAKPAGLQLLT